MNNEIKFGALINWLNGDKTGTNPFNAIPDCPGIYKIFVADEYSNEIEFGEVRTVNGKPFCPAITKSDGRVVKVTLTNPTTLQKCCTEIGEKIIYIGKATSLKKRLRQYAHMALGGHSHRGGIDIFAVQNYDKVLGVAWYPLAGDNAVKYQTADEWETAEIEKFKQEHNWQRPLANRAK